MTGMKKYYCCSIFFDSAIAADDNVEGSVKTKLIDCPEMGYTTNVQINYGTHVEGSTVSSWRDLGQNTHDDTRVFQE